MSAAVLDPLPPRCYALIGCRPAGQRIVVIRQGFPGFFETEIDDPMFSLQQAKVVVDLLNGQIGVTEEVKQAMLSMHLADDEKRH